MTERTRKAYSTDLTDEQWDLLRPHIPTKIGKGRNQEVDLREIVNAILYSLVPVNFTDLVSIFFRAVVSLLLARQ